MIGPGGSLISTNNERPKIGVVGGSLGGLAAAQFLRSTGAMVDVFERSRRPLGGQGAGIVLNPATVRFLDATSADVLDAMSIRTRFVRYLGDDGRVLAAREDGYRFSSYDRLYSALFTGFGPEHYHLGKAVRDFSQSDEEAILEFEDGSAREFDLVVFADGIGSAARAKLLPLVQPVYAGYVAWRGSVSIDSLSSFARQSFDDAITYHLMSNGHILVYPIPGANQDADRALNWLWYVNIAKGPSLDEVMTDASGERRDVSVRPGAVAEPVIKQMREASAVMPSSIRELLATTEHPFLQAIFDIDVPKMAFGRICLIGDAAFAARPHAAAGSAKAVEDAYQLANSLRHHDDVRSALAEWEPERLRYGRQLLEATRAAGIKAQFEGRMQPGDALPFGLYKTGDSIATESGWRVSA